MKSFKADPFAIVSMTLILYSAGDDDGVMYEVAELGSSKKDVWYEVQLEGGADLIQFDQKEMTMMVEDSVILMT
jgi:hypothetical protein